MHDLSKKNAERPKLITFISSNDFDYLFEQLKTQLYRKSNILTRKLLVFPSDPVLAEVEKRLLLDRSNGLSFGYRAVNLNLSFDILGRGLNPDLHFPKKESLTLSVIENFFKKKNEEKGSFEEVRRYLADLDDPFPFFSELSSACLNMMTYALEEGVNVDAHQFPLDLLEDLTEKFDFPSQVLTNPDLSIQNLVGFEIYFFGLSMIPPIFFPFLSQIARYVPLYFYLPSVTYQFALDLYPGLEVKKEEQNRLLTLFQGASKPLFRWLIDESCFHDEGYFFKKNRIEAPFLEQKDPFSVREALQFTLLQALPSDPNKKILVTQKEDFFVFEALSQTDEVLELIDQIKKKVWDEKIFAYEEMIVICPQLEQYAALLAYHFQYHRIGYEILGSLAYQESLFDQLSVLFSFVQSRFTKQDLIDFLEGVNLSIYFGLDKSTVKELKKIINKTRITFGYDSRFRKKVFSKHQKADLDQELEIGTFLHFFDQLVLSQVCSFDQLAQSTYGPPFLQIDTALFQAVSAFHEALEQIVLFKELLEDEKFTFEEALKKTLELLGYFFSGEEVEQIRALFQSELDTTDHVPFSGQLFVSLFLMKIEKQKRGLKSGSENKITITQDLEGVSLGKKWVYVIGADETVYPEKEKINQIDLSRRSHQLFSIEKAKNRFLQLIGCCESTLCFSFSKISIEGKERLISPFLSRLLQELESICFSEQGSVFDLVYQIVKKEPMEKKKDKQLKPHLVMHAELPSVLQIEDCIQLLKRPIQFFCQKALDLYFPYEELESEFSIATFQLNRLVEKSLKEEIELLIEQEQYQGKWPQDQFAYQTKKNCIRQSDQLKKQLKQFGFLNQQGAVFYFKKTVAEIKKPEKNFYRMPALQIKLDCGNIVYVEGKIETISPGLLFIPTEGKKELIFKYWPKLLLAAQCSKELNEKWFFTAFDGKIRTIETSDLENYWQIIVEYYRHSIEKVPYFESKNIEEELEKKKETDPYSRYFFLSDFDTQDQLEKFCPLQEAFDRYWLKIEDESGVEHGKNQTV